MATNITPLVSICVITYNHERFIKDSLINAINQKTEFVYDIVVGDDFSSDNTYSICKDLLNLYPYKIKLLCSDKHLGAMNNFIRTIKACRGKYIALCEGDDYWIDKNKLQKQVDFLDKNPDFIMCSHNHDTLVDGKIIENKFKYKNELTIVDLANNIPFNTLSVVFRNDQFDINGYNKANIPYTNFLFLFLAQSGKIYHFNESMAVYRIHSGGIWGGIKKFERALLNIRTLEKIIIYFSDNSEVVKGLKNRYVRQCLLFSYSFLANLNLIKFVLLTFRSLKYGFRYMHIKTIMNSILLIFKKIFK